MPEPGSGSAASSTDRLRIGVDLGGTKTEAVVVRLGEGASMGGAPEVLARRRVPTERELGYEHVVEATRAIVLEVAREAGLSALPPVGVGMPGGTTTRRHDGSSSPVPLVKNSNTTCLNGRPFRADLARALGAAIAFANDATCFALAEAAWGAAKDARVAFGAILGTGVGGGLVWRDPSCDSGSAPRAWDGAQGIAGEWGHVALDPTSGPLCYCGRRGCVETYLSGPAIEAAYASRAGAALPLATIAELAERGEETARDLLRETMDTFGRALATVIDVLDPDVVVLGGGVSNLTTLYDDGARAVRRWVFNDDLVTRIEKNALGDSAGVLGAALLP